MLNELIMRSLEEIEILFLSNLLMIGAIFFSISFIEDGSEKIINLSFTSKVVFSSGKIISLFLTITPITTPLGIVNSAIFLSANSKGTEVTYSVDIKYKFPFFVLGIFIGSIFNKLMDKQIKNLEAVLGPVQD